MAPSETTRESRLDARATRFTNLDDVGRNPRVVS
jgi:hypothetical protein